jgi:DNA (cytosine-5)-methyltransferase 1
MLKVLLTSTTAWYSDRCKLIWKKKVSKSNVLLYQLQASVLGIKEKEFGLSDVMYPTPTVGCEEGGEQSKRVEQTKSGGFILRKKNKPNSTFGAKLSDAMLYLEKMYPTPMSRDYKDINYNTTWKMGKKAQLTMAREVLKNNKPGGKLNPNFVEFLMGYPMNWTKIDPTE